MRCFVGEEGPLWERGGPSAVHEGLLVGETPAGQRKPAVRRGHPSICQQAGLQSTQAQTQACAQTVPRHTGPMGGGGVKRCRGAPPPPMGRQARSGAREESGHRLPPAACALWLQCTAEAPPAHPSSGGMGVTSLTAYGFSCASTRGVHGVAAIGV